MIIVSLDLLSKVLWGNAVETSFQIKNATKARRKDVEKAIDIYVHTVDDGSDTNTNEIYDYINNNYEENRIMFFYVLYHNGEVEGYAEYAFLPKSSVLVIDYLCTESRNHTYFYNYYHLLLEDITMYLNNQSQHIKYIITELSLRKERDVLIDTDSNYFRKLLSMEEYTLLKLPYYQPNLNEIFRDEILEFNLAIKPIGGKTAHQLVINKEFYLSLVEELFQEHYAAWYYHRKDKETVDNYIKGLYEKILHSLPNKEEFQRISVVNCALFEEGKCKQISPDNITITKIRSKRRKTVIKIVLWFAFSIVTLIFCILQSISNCPEVISNSMAVIASFLTFVTGLMTIIQFFRS